LSKECCALCNNNYNKKETLHFLCIEFQAKILSVTFFFFLSELLTVVHPASRILFIAASLSAVPGDLHIKELCTCTSFAHDDSQNKNIKKTIFEINWSNVIFFTFLTMSKLPVFGSFGCIGFFA